MDHLHKMIEALGLEIQAIKKRGGSSSVELRGGEYRGNAEGNFLYAFPITEDIYLRDESPVQVVAGKDKIEGIVVSLIDGVLVVALEEDLGPNIPFARLISDDSFLIERLKKKLEEVLSGAPTFNREKADQIIGIRTPRIGSVQADETLLIGGEGYPNPEQVASIERALGSEVTYIWGPPGTGKTETLGRIVEGYYRLGLSVLIVSNTNVAVDTVLEKVGDRLRTDSGFQQGAVLRYGPAMKPELRERYGSNVEIDKVVSRLGRTLEAQKRSLQDQRSEVESQAEKLRQAVRDLEEFEDAKKQLEHLSSSLEQTDAHRKQHQSKISSLAESIRSLNFNLERARSMGAMKRWLSGLDPDKLMRSISLAEAEKAGLEDALSATLNQITFLKGSFPNLNKKVESLSERLQHYPPYDECKKSLDVYEKKIGDFGQKIQEIQKQLDALRDEVIKNCKILATTVYRTYLKGQVERSFDAVIIDEASMLALPMVYYAAGLATRHVVITGDFRQLSPIVTSKGPEAEEWLRQDVFQKAGIEASVNKGETPNSLVPLRLQYRMHEDICALINDIFYNGDLKTSPLVQDRVKQWWSPLGNSPLMYLDTSSLNPWSALRLGTYSRYNVLHALLIRNIACYLKEEGFIGPAGEINEKLGIVSPYKYQAIFISRLLDEHLDGRGNKFASTVHSFQGNEKDTMIIDLTDSFGPRPSRFMNATATNEEGARLMNVAFSRARYQAILVANFNYLRKKIGENSIVGCILNHFKQNGEAIDVEEMLKIGPDDWLDGLRHIEPPSIEFDESTAGAFTEGTFYSAFQQDLKEARESIIIFSPYLTSRGVGRWIDLLRAKLTGGVRIRLVTRPPGDMGGVLDEGLEELVEGIRELGIVVDHRARMHEKFAIIDNKILWHGSLNILSHRDTSESMLRIPSSAACAQMARFVTSPARKKPGEMEEEVDLSDKENPECPECSFPTVWKTGRYGIYFDCEKGCGGKVDSAKKRRTSSRERKCPQCGSLMVRRTGKYGPFLGCTRYPDCSHTEKVQ